MNYQFTDADIKLIESALCELSNHADIETLDKIEELIEYIHKQSRES